jgi:hypothetical protein
MTLSKAFRLLLIFCTAVAWSQPRDDIFNQHGYVAFAPLFQGWSLEDGVRFSQLSVGVYAFAPLNRNLSVSLRGTYASCSGDITRISELCDTQLSLNYHLEAAHIVFSCGVNLPTGRRELSSEEFGTSVLLSYQLFGLAAPNYGQGFSVNPGVSWAVKANEDVVLGLGGTYHYKGGFKPLAGVGEYDPGDELLLTGGVDCRLSEHSSVSADVIFTAYQSDRFEGDDIFAAGNKWVASVRFRSYLGSDELSLLGRYRSRLKDDIAIDGVMTPQKEKVLPDEIEISAQFLMQVGNRLMLNFLVNAALFQSTSLEYSGANVYALGISPEFVLSPALSLPVVVKAVAGRQNNGKFLGGMEVGVGIRASF